MTMTMGAGKEVYVVSHVLGHFHKAVVRWEVDAPVIVNIGRVSAYHAPDDLAE